MTFLFWRARLFEVVGEGEVAEREAGGVALPLFVPGAGELGLGAQVRDPGLGGALHLDFGRGVSCAGGFEDETRAGDIARDGPVDEGLGDGVGLRAGLLVDGGAETGCAMA